MFPPPRAADARFGVPGHLVRRARRQDRRGRARPLPGPLRNAPAACDADTQPPAPAPLGEVPRRADVRLATPRSRPGHAPERRQALERARPGRLAEPCAESSPWRGGADRRAHSWLPVRAPIAGDGGPWRDSLARFSPSKNAREACCSPWARRGSWACGVARLGCPWNLAVSPQAREDH
jgi:hypothetical protein